MNSDQLQADPTGTRVGIAYKVRNMAFFYGGVKKALDNINVDLASRAVTAIIGPSGCGKSTFLKSLNRIAEAETKVRIDGQIELFGQNIYDPVVNLTRLRRRVGMVFQRPNPFPMSIFDNIAYGPRVFGMKGNLAEIVESSLKKAALWNEVKDNLKKSALGLSGGQQQRLCIARSLAVNPDVLLMDEPCSALDPIATLRIEELIESLREQLTIIIVTHNMQQAGRCSQYTLFFNTDESRIGQLVEAGPTRDIFFSPKDKRTEDYITGRFG
ncbi:phosphate ABC transporter ATP-binding protein PstB [Gloeobacter kilaueensis]|uniref:Phosphate ABC transporter, ATP-binding protein n=1 Tax=Gloeobacter kilaueensis (strain ATCC BAA-2537 / CCAP 1431/1 / ULC 316 / JS1) TaxID=1183438 RepID=U5QC76_GLOK1|nr:phosphate ABC transporter ATP-binding protein PstB [Gloeobacter kilaueensis]AGY56512.1 phosphate ABC transporter, ATP-binding protein [Gloeobacter kilaueensis JS1]